MHRSPIYICDDYGLNESVDVAIIELLEKKKVAGCSVMMTHHSQRKETLKKINEAQIGIHLNLTEGRALSSLSDVNRLVDEKGYFLGLLPLLNRIILSQIIRDQVLHEIKNQIKAFKQEYGTPSHVDTHQHIHYHPVILKLLQSALEDLGLHDLRIREGRFTERRPSLKNSILSLLSIANNGFLNRRMIVDYELVKNKKALEEQDNCEYILHVAHPNIIAYDFDKTSYTYQNRVSQFFFRMSRQ